MTLPLFSLHLFPTICKMYIQKSAEDCKNFQSQFDFVLNFIRLNVPSFFFMIFLFSTHIFYFLSLRDIT